MTTVILDQNGIKTDKEVDFSSLKTVTDILKALNINEETVLIFFKETPIPFDEKIEDIGRSNIHDGDFRILKVIFDGL